jgi:FemAB-related protein (PEP-CTERM system-associated)
MNAPINVGYSVRLVQPGDPALARRIEGFVAEQRASIFHRPAWLRAVEVATGHRAIGLLAERLGTITGWLPLTEARSLLFGNSLVSSGFGVGGGICATSDSAGMALADAAIAHAGTYGFTGIELRGGAIPRGWKHWNDRHCGFERPLADDDDSELLAIPRKARAEVRKGLANGLEVRLGRAQDDLEMHYRVYAESVRNLGTPVFPKRLFAAMLDAFRGESDILTIVQEGVPIASVLSFYHDGAVMPFWGGGTREARKLRANELMYYRLMLHARRCGMQRFDFGRSKTESGPYHFKKNWGFEPAPMTYAAWTAPGEAPRDVDPTSAAYSRKIALWKTLPLSLANLLGPRIARDLA